MPDQTMAANELKNDKSRQMFSPRTRPLKPSLTIHDWYTNITQIIGILTKQTQHQQIQLKISIEILMQYL